MYATLLAQAVTATRPQERPRGRRLGEAEFLALYERTARSLAAYLQRLTREPEQAKDLLQETYLRLLRSELPRLEREQMVSYLFRTATRLVYDGWRRGETARRWRRLQPRGEPVAAGAGGGLKPDLDRILGRLRVRDRALLWLAYVEGCSHREIGHVLGLRPASVRVLLHRARRKLAAELEREGLGGEVLQ